MNTQIITKLALLLIILVSLSFSGYPQSRSGSRRSQKPKGENAATQKQAKVAEEIQKLKHEDKAVRSKAAEALGRLKDPLAIESLIFALKDESYEVRGEARSALVQIGAPAIKLLLNALKDENPRIREGAAQIFGEMGVTQAVELLIAALEDDNDRVRFEAAYALGKLKDPRAIDPLTHALRNGTSSWAAGFALGEIGAPAFESLLDALNDQSKKVRLDAVLGLGSMEDTRSIQPLIDILGDAEFEIRNQAMKELTRKGAPAISPLVTALQNQDPQYRIGSAFVLGKIKDVRAVEPLISVLRDDDPKVRREAARALAGINDPRSTAHLIAAFEAKSLEIIAGASSYFIFIGEPGTEDILIEALTKYGDARTCEALLNSGNQRLQGVAREWAKNHGYMLMNIPSVPGSNKWGAGRKKN